MTEKLPDLEQLANLLKVLGHAVRLKIVTTLADGEYSVGEIEKLCDLGQPGLSQQLAVLRGADLVTTRREAKLVYYRLNGEKIDAICSALGWLHQPRGAAQQSLGDADRQRKLGTGATFARIL